jgi:hypothetical protein
MGVKTRLELRWVRGVAAVAAFAAILGAAGEGRA